MVGATYEESLRLSEIMDLMLTEEEYSVGNGISYKSRYKRSDIHMHSRRSSLMMIFLRSM